MKPIVSVIMATKNSEACIAESLNSIMAQSFQSYEVIIVDGDSTDRTVEIASQYAKVTIVRQSGIGFADAWNCGIAESQGKYLSFLDSDDLWASDKLALQVTFLETNAACDAVIARVRFFSDQSQALPETFRPALLVGSHLAHMPGALLVRRDVFARIGTFDPALSVASDIDWFAKLKDAGIEEGFVDQVLIHKRVHQTNLSYTGAKEPRYDKELLLSLRRSIVRQREAEASISATDEKQKNWPALSFKSRAQFVSAVRGSVVQGSPFAAGKLGVSETRWLYYPLFLRDEKDPRKRAAYDANLKFHALKQSGIFPGTSEFLQSFAEFYLGHLRNLDSIGWTHHGPMERELVARHGLAAELIDFKDQEPDRNIPAEESRCYLPSFKGKKVLLVSPFASLLCENATPERFEAVWKKTGKAWFFPANVIPLEFPYGLAKATQREYPSVIELYAEICRKISEIDFDVALVGAGALNIPLVSHVKATGKVGIALGGHLQILFGILGKRWLERPDWMADYVTEAWLPMTASYIPEERDVADQGAYW